MVSQLNAHSIFEFRKAGILWLSAESQDSSRKVGDLRGKLPEASLSLMQSDYERSPFR